MSERQKQSKKAIEAKARQEELQKGFQKGNGKSRLEQLELEEDDAVYDMLDEDQYEKLVESRRNAVDFVVDDEGHGYADDGEEHLGVAEDEYDHKKRIQISASEDADSKLARKARKLAEVSSSVPQKNSMLNYVKPGVSTTQRMHQPKSMTNDNLLDVDSLLQNMQSSLTTSGTGSNSSSLHGNSNTSTFKPKSLLSKPIIPSRMNSNTSTGGIGGRPHLISSNNNNNSRSGGLLSQQQMMRNRNQQLSHKHSSSSNNNDDGDIDNYISYDNNNHDNGNYNHGDYGYDNGGGGDDYGDDGHNTDAYKTPTEKWRQPSSSAVVSPGSGGGATETTSSTTATVPMDTVETSTIQKISLSKTNKKLTFVEPIRSAAASGNSNSLRNGSDGTGVFKPLLGDNAVSLGLGDISGADGSSGTSGNGGVDGSSNIGTGIVSEIRSVSAGSIDPKFWLQRSVVSAPVTAATETVAKAADDSTSDTMTTKAAVTAEEEFVNMFWLDACEANGVIYLFGKIPINEPNVATYYVSCCVAVHGAERNLFALPRATGTFKSDGSVVRAGMAEVYAEINHLLVPNIIPKQQGSTLFRCKAVKRKYAFEHGEVPREETEYMKIVYSARHPVPTVEQCGQGGRYIERIFGNTSSALELFLLKRGLMGPCWLTIRHPRTVTDSLSWCKIEMGVENPKFISKMAPNIKGDSLPTPPLVSMCVSMKTVLNPATHLHEIVAISGLIHTKVEGEKDTEMDPKYMKRFTYIRPLGLTCGPHYPAAFPHDLPQEIKKIVIAQGSNNNNNQGGAVLQQLPNERALINIFFARVQQEDPDIFASHNLFGFEFDVLLSRALVNKVNEWSRVGRLRRTKVPKTISDKDITSGRILCDTYKAAKEFLRETTYSLSSLSLTQLNVDRVEVDPVDVPKYFSNSTDIIKIANHTACDANLVQRLVLKLQIVPLTKQLTNLSGNLWSRTVRGARAERIEYLLLHEFYSLKYILPEKKAFADNPSSSATNSGNNNSNNKKGGNNKLSTAAAGSRNAHMQSQRMMENDNDNDDNDNGGGQHTMNRVGGNSRTRAKASYAGGLVLEPKKGLYDTYILLLDFNSLYPSLIQEYNLCFTTIEWTKYMGDSNTTTTSDNDNKLVKKLTNGGDGDDNEVDEEAVVIEDEQDGDGLSSSAKSLPPLPDADSGKGILPRVIKALVERRKEVKNLLKKENDGAKRQQLDIRQKALKLTANSMYGCLGFAFSRFYARPIAALVTSMGRDALQRTVDQATNQFGLDVIYGDTDSVMINTNSTDLAHVKEVGNLVKKEVNKLYKSLELDLDGIFKSMLLLKKKKYAAVVIKEDKDGVVTYEKELKGLDLVRRDWCPLSKDTGKYVVDQILSGNPREDIVNAIHDYLTELSRKIRNHEIALEHFVVTKGLNKNPRDYPDTKGQPHLQVALAMLKANKPVNIGDHIPYVICKQALNPVVAVPVVTAASEAVVQDENNNSDSMNNKSNAVIIEQQSPTNNTDVVTKPIEATMRAHHPDDVIRNPDTLTLDYEWYLTNQILPPISRLCEPIEGTSTAALSQCLGLDTSKYTRIGGNGDGENDDWGFTPQCKMDDAERFKDCMKLKCKCLKCHQESEFTGAYLGAQNHTGLDCAECGAKYYGRKLASDVYAYLSNRVTLLTRECMRKYYDCWFVCDDPTCHRRTMQQPMAGMSCVSDCHGRLVQEYTEAQLHTQLKYLEALFDMERALRNKNQDANGGDQVVLNKAKILLKELPPDYKEVFRLLHIQLYNTIAGSAFNWVRPSLWTVVFGRLLPPAVSGIGGVVSVGGR